METNIIHIWVFFLFCFLLSILLTIALASFYDFLDCNDARKFKCTYPKLIEFIKKLTFISMLILGACVILGVIFIIIVIIGGMKLTYTKLLFN